MTTKRVLFVGDATHCECREPVAWLREYCQLTIKEDVPSARTWLASVSVPPDAIVISAARPGLFSQSDVASLLCCAPLARLIGLMGGWCEGEVRTGQPWRGLTRVYWHQFVPRISQELNRIDSYGQLAMPRTFTDSEVSGMTVPVPEASPRGLLVVRAVSLETYQAIADACHAIGHATVWQTARQPSFVTGTVGAIWDVSSSMVGDVVGLKSFVKRVSPAPVVAIMGFPKVSDRQLALDCGASAMVSKPYLLQELWSELARVTAKSMTPTRHSSAA